ncbi:MAG: hypothetical protein ACRCWR_04855 [Saezia sp.]
MSKAQNEIPNSIEKSMQMQAHFLISAFSAEESPIDGTKLDFSKSSLMLVDQILRDFYIEQAVLPDDLHFIASCYVFETLRLCFGGRYLKSDTPNDFVLMLGEPDSELICLVMERVWACAKNWEPNRLVIYYDTVEELLQQKQNTQIGATSK